MVIDPLKYRLYETSNNDPNENIEETFFRDRGIDDYKTYMHLDESCVIPYTKLDNIHTAVDLFNSFIIKRKMIGILVDEDVDGFCSASMMYLWIKHYDKDYPVKYIMHEKAKTHGLSANDIVIPEGVELLIIPDAGTNDCDECNFLIDQCNVGVLILDHHEKTFQNKINKAVIVNNQTSDEYQNKQLCGAGVVYKFLQALDGFYNIHYADEFLDLCAFANISDVMDMRSFETKYLVDKGLKRIKNKFMSALIEAQSYSMNGVVNIHNVQWYMTPVVNGCIRFGTAEEKELLFRAFIETDEVFEYKKRATKTEPSKIIEENIYDRAARLSKNAKSRQDKARDKGVAELSEIISHEIQDDDKVIICDATNIVDTSLSGVVAIKMADIFKRPCILLQKHVSRDERGNRKIVYGGSARNIDHSPILSFKDVVNDTNVIKGQGHANAFGIVDMPIDKIDEAKTKFNEMLKDVEYDSTYRCDYILDIDSVNNGIIIALSDFKDYLGQGIDEPIIAVENIYVYRDEIELIGKNSDTIKFVKNDIEYVKFRCSKDDPILNWVDDCWNDEDYIQINIVGKPGVNIYNGIKTLQVIIEDAEIIKSGEGNTFNVWDEESDDLDYEDIW